jgi:hypothetical protein
MSAQPVRSASTEMTVPQPTVDEPTLPADRTVVVVAPGLRTLLLAHRRAVGLGGAVLAGIVAAVVAARCGATNDLAAHGAPQPQPTPTPLPPPAPIPPPAPPPEPTTVAVELTPIDAAVAPAPVDAASTPPVPEPESTPVRHPPAPQPRPQPTHDPALTASDCAPSMMETLRSSATVAFSAGDYALAMSRFELLYRCGDAAALAPGYMAACNAQNVGHARALFQKLAAGQRQTLKQICLRQNIDPEKP